jgi:hypothetical protein
MACRERCSFRKQWANHCSLKRIQRGTTSALQVSLYSPRQRVKEALSSLSSPDAQAEGIIDIFPPCDNTPHEVSKYRNVDSQVCKKFLQIKKTSVFSHFFLRFFSNTYCVMSPADLISGRTVSCPPPRGNLWTHFYFVAKRCSAPGERCFAIWPKRNLDH